MPKKIVAALLATMALVALAACESDRDELVVYSGRNQNLIGELLEEYARDTGVDIRVKYAETSQLLPTLLEEGDRTRVDVFISQDAGALAELSRRGMLARLPRGITERVEPRFRATDGTWVGVTARARVIAYNTDQVDASDLPQSVFDVIDPRWRGRVGVPPDNASFIAFVSALRDQVGDRRAREFLDGLAANGVKTYDNNVITLDAVASGEIDLGLVNHYYLYNEFQEQGDAPVANHYPGQGPEGEGTFINVAGAAVIEGTNQSEAARDFVRFLLSERAQRYFREETAEYPLASDVAPIPELPALGSLKTIDVPLERLGADLERTVRMIEDAGLS